MKLKIVCYDEDWWAPFWIVTIPLPWIDFYPDRGLIWWVASAYGLQTRLPEDFNPEFVPF